MKGSAEIWASRGMPWNEPNYQHRASSREFKTIRQPDGTIDRVGYDEIEGYDGWAIGASPRAAIRKREFHEPKGRKLDPEARLRANRILRATPRKEVIRVV